MCYLCTLQESIDLPERGKHVKEIPGKGYVMLWDGTPTGWAEAYDSADLEEWR